MRILIGTLLAMLLSAAPAQASFRITVDGITYESSFADKRTNYSVNGKVVAFLRKNKDKDRWEFMDTNDSLIGYAVEVKTGYAYFDKYGNPAGTVEIIPPPDNFNRPDAIYRDSFGNVIGYSQRDGCFRRNFLDAYHNIIGAELGSNALPLRPLPVEIWLKMQR